MPDDPYRAVAGLYDPATALFLSPPRRLVRDVLARLGARRVLDVCCGTGRQTLLLRRAGFEAFGVDLSLAMLAVARQAAGPAVSPFARMDARALAVADGAFDATAITLALHENEEPDRLAMGRAMVRATRPGGHVLVLDYAAPAGISVMGGLVVLAERLAGAAHYRNYRDFMARKGVSGFARRLGLPVLAAHPCLAGRAALLVLAARPARPDALARP
uniref:Methylase involved in ubiquinone/menaquinone biosynthesis n=1 Tax=Desulfovibrio sp. U5L TaxID=596152 RepID=I2Q7B4_9BACT